ncbi:MAG: DUF4160 domain-containing protein [Waddliaceae bacterium]
MDFGKRPNRAKFWIEPVVSLANNYGFISKELNELKNQIEENKERIKEKWHEHFNI